MKKVLVIGASSWKRHKLSASCFVERSAKLFDKGARRRQIKKAPAVINLPVSECSTSKSRRGVVRLVKTDNLTVQFDIQSIRGSGHLDNKGVFPLVDVRLPARANDISRLGKWGI